MVGFWFSALIKYCKMKMKKASHPGSPGHGPLATTLARRLLFFFLFIHDATYIDDCDVTWTSCDQDLGRLCLFDRSLTAIAVNVTIRYISPST